MTFVFTCVMFHCKGWFKCSRQGVTQTHMLLTSFVNGYMKPIIAKLWKKCHANDTKHVNSHLAYVCNKWENATPKIQINFSAGVPNFHSLGYISLKAPKVMRATDTPHTTVGALKLRQYVRLLTDFFVFIPSHPIRMIYRTIPYHSIPR